MFNCIVSIIHYDTIYLPFNTIKGISSVITNKIIDVRKDKFIDIYDRDVRNKLDNIMYQIGKLDLPEVKLTKEQQEELSELSALNMDKDMLRIKWMKERLDKNPNKAGEKLTELTNE